MWYVLLTPEGTVDRYPYTLTDLRRANPNTSFTKKISDETAAGFNCYPVTMTERPADDHTVNLERTAVNQGGNWVEQWVSTPATPEQIAERVSNKASEVRAQRNDKLTASDWTQVADAPVDAAAWAAYRAELRAVPEQAGFPYSVVWPTEPQ